MKKNILILIFALIASSFCFGQQNFWRRKLTPNSLYARAIAPNSQGWLYIATSNGVYVTKNSAESYIQTNLKKSIRHLTVNEQDDIFAIPTEEDRLYYSKDGGDTWVETNLPPSSKVSKTEFGEKLNDNRIQSFYVNGDTLICAGINYPIEIWKSNDLGVNWTCVHVSSMIVYETSVLFERNNGVLLAGMAGLVTDKNERNSLDLLGNLGIFLSDNGGDTWNYWYTNIHSGRPDNVQDIVENSKNHLFVGASYYFPDMSGIYVTKDNGDTWQHLVDNPSRDKTILTISPNDVVYAYLSGDINHRKLIRSFDDGVTWRQINYSYYDAPLNHELNSLCVSPDGYLYATWYKYLLRSKYPVTGKTCTTTVSIVPADAGVVVGSGSYHENETVALTAQPFAGFEFANWSLADGTVLSENREYSFQITEDVNIIANFRYNSAINELAGKAISVYPNPFTEKLQIDGLASDRATISISDIQGREVYRGIYTGDAINLSHLLPGVYILNVKADGKSGAYKIVKSMSN